MADLVLGCGAELRHRLCVAIRDEQRIVAKALRPSELAGDAALADAVGPRELPPSCVDDHDRAPKACPALRLDDIGELVQELLVVARIGRALRCDLIRSEPNHSLPSRVALHNGIIRPRHDDAYGRGLEDRAKPLHTLT